VAPAGTSVATVTVRVPAKVNLHLGVGARRPDGYHELTTVFSALSLYDEVIAIVAEDRTLSLTGEGADRLPTDERNLALRAAAVLAERTGTTRGVALRVAKAIPVAGGLAGGSADAAGALLACDALWGTGLSREELQEIGAELGSDVPFALAGGNALGTGRGDRLSPVLSAGTFSWVLALAEGGLSTTQAYADLDARRSKSAGAGGVGAVGEPDAVLTALRTGDAVLLGRALANDLGPVAVSRRPDLRRTLAAGRELGALGAVISGSGPTCAFLARSAPAAVELAAALAGAGVCRTVRRANGPVPGARVVARAAA